MNRYVAFLRAINVGGTTIIKMSDLKRTFESFGLEDVKTYIQTGNVIFESKEEKADALEERIERQLEDAVGKQIRLFLRTAREVAQMAKQCPFQPREGEIAYVVILEKKPARKSLEALLSLRTQADDFAIQGREVFVLRRDRERSLFSNNLVEKTLGVAGTTRNLTTIKKLAENYT